MKPALLSIAFVLVLVGCGGRIYPVTSGFHAPGESFGLGRDMHGRFVPTKPETVVIWANDPNTMHHLAGILLSWGYGVVERARLQRILDEQNLRISLANSTEQLNEEILKAGKLAGASQVLFVEVAHEPTWKNRNEATSAQAALRMVSVETGQIRLSGTAHVSTDGLYVLRDTQEEALAELALRRAVCPIEAGWLWQDPSEDMAGGCAKQTGR